MITEELNTKLALIVSAFQTLQLIPVTELAETKDIEIFYRNIFKIAKKNAGTSTKPHPYIPALKALSIDLDNAPLDKIHSAFVTLQKNPDAKIEAEIEVKGGATPQEQLYSVCCELDEFIDFIAAAVSQHWLEKKDKDVPRLPTEIFSACMTIKSIVENGMEQEQKEQKKIRYEKTNILLRALEDEGFFSSSSSEAKSMKPVFFYVPEIYEALKEFYVPTPLEKKSLEGKSLEEKASLEEKYLIEQTVVLQSLLRKIKPVMQHELNEKAKFRDVLSILETNDKKFRSAKVLHEFRERIIKQFIEKLSEKNILPSLKIYKIQNMIKAGNFDAIKPALEGGRIHLDKAMNLPHVDTRILAGICYALENNLPLIKTVLMFERKEKPSPPAPKLGPPPYLPPAPPTPKK